MIIIVMGLLMYDFELNSNFVAPGNDDKACDFCYSNPSFSVAFLYLVSISLGLKAGSRFCNELEPEPGRDLLYM